MIKGNLSSFSLGEIFQSLAVNNHTGTLKILEKDGTEKYVYFSQGEICLFSNTSHPTLRVGEILVRHGTIEPTDLEHALQLQKDTSEKLGQILVKEFGVSPEEIQEALITKIHDEIYDLFLLSEAEFEFLIDHFPDDAFESFPDNVRISINPYGVVMEGLRVADEWKVIKKKIKTFHEIYTFSSSNVKTEFESPMDTALAGLIDGESPVRKLFDAFPGNRFECCKTIFGFLGAGLIRHLTLQECRQKGLVARRTGDMEKAFDYLQFAVDLSPDRAEPLVLIGTLLEKMGRGEDGGKYLREALRIYAREAAHAEVVKIGWPLIDHYARDEDFLRVLFESSVCRKKIPVIEACGEVYATVLISKGFKQKAAEILQQVCEFIPQDLDRKTRAASLLKEAGCVKGAVAMLEEVDEVMAERPNVGERIRVLRTIFEYAPDRQEIKQTINNLLELQERREHKAKRRFTIAGATVICLLLLLVVPLLYELKARELWSHSRRLEEISRTSGNYAVARASYGELVESYPLSTQAGIAREAIGRLEQIERLTRESEVHKTKAIEDEQTRKVKDLKMALTKLLKDADAREKKADHEGAFQILKRISSDFPELPGTKLVALPTLITSSPAECDVTIGGKKVGVTPFLLRDRAGTTVSFRLSRTGCEDLQKTIVIGSSWNFHVELKLHPLAQFQPFGPVHRPIDVHEEALFMVSRDGFLYSIDPADESANWRRPVGTFGDLTSPPTYTDAEIYLGNVEGEVAAFSRSTGDPRWQTSLKSTILAAPSISENGLWVAVGDLDGNVFILDNCTGKPLAAFRTENEILQSPRFAGSLLVVPGQDNSLHVLTVPELGVSHVESLIHDIDTELVIDSGAVYFATRDGTVHCHVLHKRQTTWRHDVGERVSSTPLQSGSDLYVTTQSGKVLALDTASGRPRWERQVAQSAPGEMLFRDTLIYFGTDSGELVGFSTVSRELQWLFHFEDTVREAPAILHDHLLFVSASGKVVLMQIFEKKEGP